MPGSLENFVRRCQSHNDDPPYNYALQPTLHVARLKATLAIMKVALVLMLCVAGTASASDARFRGRFYWGHEMVSFHPCGSKKAYWVDIEENLLKPLRDRSEKLREERREPYPPIYLEAVGKIDTKSKREGFAEDYDGLFVVKKVTRVSDIVPSGCAK
jgi:hypothetical protein